MLADGLTVSLACFRGNRYSEIITLLSNAYWHQVRSRDNPADATSRGVGPARMRELSLWRSGSTWFTAEPVP